MNTRKLFSIYLLCLSLLAPCAILAQGGFETTDINSDDLNVGGDIFSDFNDDLEASQVFEDERFYRYGRFFSFNVGLGITDFTGNRGAFYTFDDHPSFHMSFNYFVNFQFSVDIGVEFSKHTAIFDSLSLGFDSIRPGAIEVNFFRTFLGFRYYVDTTNLGTAITYSNPYFVFRGEYWRQTNKFVERRDQEGFEDQKGGGVGVGLGFGLEFPVILKERYINVEFLWHQVNFFDKRDTDFAQIPNNPESTQGFDDLTGNVWSLFVTYNITW